MGIPSLTSFVKLYYSTAVETIYSSTLLPQYDNLYIDLNSVIHYCIRGHGMSLSDNGFEELTTLVINELDKIMMYINPQRLVFISVDGTVPRCKSTEQRKRRFTSNIEEDSPTDDNSADRNVISPGTEFMEALNSALKYYIAFRISTDPVWKKLKVIYSSHRSPGEGEQKIMNYIRESIRLKTFNRNHRNIIYGNDADFILMSLLLHWKNVDTMYHERVDQSNLETQNHEMNIIHISVLRDYLILELTAGITWIKKSDYQQIIEGFVFVMLVYGNDFIPRLPLLYSCADNIHFLIDVYHQLLSSKETFLINDNSLDLTAFRWILYHIDEKTQSLFSRLKHKLLDSVQEIVEWEMNEHINMAQSEPCESLKKYQCFLNEIARYRKGCSYDDYRSLYYRVKCKVDYSEDGIRSICDSYYHGIFWVFRYFTDSVPSWSWMYRYHYAPFPNDLAKYLSDTPSFSLNEPVSPFIHLLCCLSPLSASLLPPSYARLMTDPSSPLLPYYGTNFYIDSDGDFRSHRKVVWLPFVDEKKVIEAVEKYHCDASLTDDERIRNEKECSYLFSYSDVQSEWVSPLNQDYFPSLSNCHCHVDNIETFSEVVQLIGWSHVLGKLSIFPSLFPLCSSLKRKSLLQDRNTVDVPFIQVYLPDYPFVDTVESTRRLGEELFRKIVFYDYPNAKMALVEGIRTVDFGCDLTTDVNAFKLKDKKEFLDVLEIIKNRSYDMRKYRVHIDLQEERIILLLRPVTAIIRKTRDKMVIPQLDKQPFYYPYSLVIRRAASSPINGSLSLGDYALQNLQVGSEVVFWKPSSKYHGSHGIVKELNGDDAEVELEYTPQPMIKVSNEKWVNESTYFEKKSQIYQKVVSYLWRGWHIRSTKQFLSFGFINPSQQLVMKGYARCDPTHFSENSYPLTHYSSLAVRINVKKEEFQLSEAAIQFTEQFMQRFGNEVTRKGKYGKKTVIISPSKDMVDKMTRWIDQNLKKGEMIPYDYSTLCPDDRNRLLSMNLSLDRSETLVATCYYQDLYQREIQYHIYPESSIVSPCPALGSRVVIVQDASIPFGSQGTVIGTYSEKRWIEILLDRPSVAADDYMGRIVTIPLKYCLVL